MDIDSLSNHTDFEVIETMDEKNPYPPTLTIDWAIDMKWIINLKSRRMKFKKKSLHVVVLLDPVQRERYTKPVHDEGSDCKLDFFYQITTQLSNQMQSLNNRKPSWECDSIYTMDSKEEA